MEVIFRIIQSVTSPKVEPLKAWLAKVGSERIEETIDRAFATYLKKGYSRHNNNPSFCSVYSISDSLRNVS